jgi:L-threonylcarbamoyladenylate synthase
MATLRGFDVPQEYLALRSYAVTEIFTIDPVRPDPAAIARAAECLRGGGLVAFPTETVYGLGANALDRMAVRRIFDVKGRPFTDPLIVHVTAVTQAEPLVQHLPDTVRTLAARFWPGPLTVVLPRSALVPDEVTAGLATVAIRMPAHPIARALIDAAGIPIAAPSANLFSRPSPTRAAHVLEDLGDRVDIVIDGGPTGIGVESTVLDMSRDSPTVLRPGAVTLEMLREVLPRVDMHAAAAADAGGAMPSPGMLSRHYSPRAPLTLYEGSEAAVGSRMALDAHAAISQGRTVGILAADQDAFPEGRVVRVGSRHDIDAVASRLYAALRELDAAGVDQILARGFPAESGLGVAVQDRLRRAAGGRVITVAE